MTRSLKFGAMAGALALMAVTQGCTEKKAADTGAMTDSIAPAAEAPAPPAELTNRSTAMVAAWNQKDPAVPAAFFADSAVVTVPQGTFNGAADIKAKWIVPGLPIVSQLAVSDQNYTGSGDWMTETGKYSETVTLPKKAPMANGGTYTINWTNVGGTWMIKSMQVTSDSNIVMPKS